MISKHAILVVSKMEFIAKTRNEIELLYNHRNYSITPFSLEANRFVDQSDKIIACVAVANLEFGVSFQPAAKEQIIFLMTA